VLALGVSAACAANRPSPPAGADKPAALTAIPRVPAHHVDVDGEGAFLYEIALANPTPDPVTIVSVAQRASGHEVTGAPGGALAEVLKASLDVDLAAARDIDVDLKASKQRRGKSAVLAPGQGSVYYGWLPAPTTARDLGVTIHSESAGQARRLEVALAVDAREPLLLAPPLRGTGWITFVGPAPAGGHRTALMNLGGKHYLAQRYALDFGKVDAEGRLLRKGGVSTNNADYAAYGERVYAVANGTIVGVHDGIADNHGTTRNPDVANTIDTILGNYVMLRVSSSSAYVVYAHLRRGSVRVAAGQTVKQGELVGEVGNSGHAGGPHLHMHVCDAASDLRCEGLPFVFESYEARTYEPVGDSIETARFQGSSTVVRRQRQLPAAERMLAF